MMLQILLYRFIRDVPGAPRSVADRPKVPAPVFLTQRWIFLLQPARGPALHSFYQVRQRLRRPILNVHVHMIFTHHSLEYAHVFRVTYLDQQLSAPQLDVSLQHRVPVLCYPH